MSPTSCNLQKLDMQSTVTSFTSRLEVQNQESITNAEGLNQKSIEDIIKQFEKIMKSRVNPLHISSKFL